MQDYEQWKTYLELKTSRETDVAARYLEQRGKRFLVDFGTQNAPGIARQLFESEVCCHVN